MEINPLSGQNLPLTSHEGLSQKVSETIPQDTYTHWVTAGTFPDPDKVRERLSQLEISKPKTTEKVVTLESEQTSQKSSMLTKTLAGFFIGTTLLGIAGCKQSPPPQPGTEPTSISTELSYLFINTKDEIELGNQVAAQIEQQNKLWQNEEALKRINDIGQSLAKTSTRKDLPYTFKLIDTDQINAFALPGGHIYITRGLYQEFNNDNELRFVMGHEMAHIEDRDSIKALERNAAFRALIEILTKKKGDFAGIAGEIAAGLSSIRFSQSDELQADSMSARHMIRDGFNPWYAVRAMEHLKSLEKQSPDLLQKLFSTHPPTKERIDNLRSIAQSYPQP